MAAMAVIKSDGGDSDGFDVGGRVSEKKSPVVTEDACEWRMLRIGNGGAK